MKNRFKSIGVIAVFDARAIETFKDGPESPQGPPLRIERGAIFGGAQECLPESAVGSHRGRLATRTRLDIRGTICQLHLRSPAPIQLDCYAILENMAKSKRTLVCF